MIKNIHVQIRAQIFSIAIDYISAKRDALNNEIFYSCHYLHICNFRTISVYRVVKDVVC